MYRKGLMYAVIELQGHQYIVQEGNEITVDKVDTDQGKKFDCEKVLLTFTEDAKTVQLGKPFVKGAKVTCEVLETKKGEKVHILKFRRKNRYQRNLGFRPTQSVLKIKKISA